MQLPGRTDCLLVHMSHWSLFLRMCMQSHVQVHDLVLNCSLSRRTS